MDSGTALGRRQALKAARQYVAGSEYVVDARDTWWQGSEQQWIIGIYAPEQGPDICGAIALAVADDGMVTEVSRLPSGAGWDITRDV